MSYINYDFPHSRNQDSDLSEIIRLYKDLVGLPKSFEDLRTFVMSYFDNVDIEAEISRKLEEMYNNGELSDIINETLNKTRNFVLISEFGAIGDGVSDDTAAFIAAINYCNANKLTLSSYGNKTYLISTAEEIAVKTSINLNGATIKLTGNGRRLLHIVRDNILNDVIINNSFLAKDHILDNTLFEKTFTIKSPLSLGLRNGNGEEAFHIQRMETDNLGYFTNSPYYPDIIEGGYTITNIEDNNSPWITIENIVFDYSDMANLADAINVNRNNVCVQNITSIGANLNINTGSVIEVDNASHVELANITAINPDIADSVWGYVINLKTVSDCVVRNVYANSGWSNIATAFITNTIIKDSVFNTLDHHYGIFNFCTMESINLTGVLQVPYGYGNFIFKNSAIHLNSAKKRNAFLLDRRDYKVPFSGSIILEDCDLIKYQPDSTYTAAIYFNIGTDAVDSIESFATTAMCITINRCKVGGKNASINSLAHINTVAPTTILRVIDCDIDTRGIISVRANNIVDLYLERSVFSGVLHTSACRNVSVVNCKLAIANLDDANVRILNSEIVSTPYTLKAPSLIITGCVVDSDANINPTGANVCINNNIIVSDTKNNQNAWNGRLV